MKRKIILIIISFVLLSILFQFFWHDSSTVQNKNNTSEQSKTMHKTPHKNQLNTITKPHKEHRTDKEGEPFPEEEFTQAWNIIRDTSDIEQIKPSFDTPMLAVHLKHPYVLLHASEGDQMTLTLPQRSPVTVHIEKVTFMPQNITQWLGRLGKADGSYPVNVTMDET